MTRSLPRAHPLSEASQLQLRWLEETRRFEWREEIWGLIDSAQLAPELDLYRVMAEEDDEFFEKWAEWSDYVYEHEIWLVVEQGCVDGVLLNTEQRIMRLQSCPEVLLRPYRWFLELCPPHVKHHVAMELYLHVRLDRSMRTGSPLWRPETARPEPPEPAFFRPPVLKLRPYGR